MDQDPLTLIINTFDKFGILPHTMPNAIGMWPNEQECLVWTASQCDPNLNWVEIGSFCGGSTILLGLTKDMWNGSGQIIAVDPTPNPMFEFNLNRSRLKNIQKFIGTSKELAQINKDPIGFLFIDGFHSFKSILQDFSLLIPWFTADTIIAFHDVSPNMWTHNKEYIGQLDDLALQNWDTWISDSSENFLIDEAISLICNKFGYRIMNIPVRQPLEYFKETGLNGWVRGRTSPHNAFTAIRKIK